MRARRWRGGWGEGGAASSSSVPLSQDHPPTGAGRRALATCPGCTTPAPCCPAGSAGRAGSAARPWTPWRLSVGWRAACSMRTPLACKAVCARARVGGVTTVLRERARSRSTELESVSGALRGVGPLPALVGGARAHKAGRRRGATIVPPSTQTATSTTVRPQYCPPPGDTLVDDAGQRSHLPPSTQSATSTAVRPRHPCPPPPPPPPHR